MKRNVIYKIVWLLLLNGIAIFSVAQPDTVIFHNDGFRFTGFLYRPVNVIKYPVVTILHGSSNGTHDFYFYQNLADSLAHHGIGTFIYDRRGSGLSQGNIEQTTFVDLARDASAGIEKIKTLRGVDTLRLGLFGISQGCWIAAITDSLRADIRFHIMVSGSTITPSEQMNFAAKFNLQLKKYSKQVIDSAMTIRKVIDDYYRGKVSYEIISRIRDPHVKKPWFTDGYIFDLIQPYNADRWAYQVDLSPRRYFGRLKVPVIVFYGDQDQWLPPKTCFADWRSYRLPYIQLHLIENVGHFMVENEIIDPKNPIVSPIYYNLLLKFVKSI